MIRYHRSCCYLSTSSFRKDTAGLGMMGGALLLRVLSHQVSESMGGNLPQDRRAS
jgi:hypothetical protein